MSRQHTKRSVEAGKAIISFVVRHLHLLGGGLFAALLALLVLRFVQFEFGEARTYGEIFVDSPEIYTRERLVNDRFLEDAWLRGKLEQGSRNAILGVTREATTSRVELGSAQKKGTGDPRVVQAMPTLTSRERLVDELDYRNQVRNLLVENQLDDRHDLAGNSLYRLKFDATIAPGRNTQATADISVAITGPQFAREAGPIGETTEAGCRRPALGHLGSDDTVDHWRVIYQDWLDSLRSRLNQTHNELKQAFASNEFSHNDYAHLITFLGPDASVQLDPKSCPPRFLRIEGQEPALVAEAHARRKDCIDSTIARRLRKPATTSQSQAIHDENPLGLIETPTEAQVATRELERSLNAFFAGKTIRLVLGISVPNTVFTAKRFYFVPELAPLIELTFFNPLLGESTSVFNVAARTHLVRAIDPARIKAEVRKRYSDFAKPDFPSEGLLVSRLAIDALQREGYPLERCDFVDLDEVPGETVAVPGEFEARAEVGLRNFANRARNLRHAFTYAVTPKENATSWLSVLNVDSSSEGLASTHIGDVRFALDRRFESESVARRGTGVGYGSASPKGEIAKFGWLIGPRSPVADGNRIKLVHTPGQYPLSALVSLPSWWSEVTVEVTTTWIDETGERLERTALPVTYSLDVPADFEPLERVLLEVQQVGPDLMESRLDPILLTACRPGSIVIPGRRLWRSTVVSLGYQIADEIAVLPNMKGIVARFKRVENQASLGERASWHRESSAGNAFEIQRKVRVWTSQGTITLPSPARIGVPEVCDDARL